MIPIYKPYLKKYKQSAINAINEEWISNHGIYVKLASDELSKIFNIKHVILMNNGTSATQCLYISLKYKYPNIKKIYIPNNVFIAAWNCGLHIYDKNIFEVMKTNQETLNIDTSEEYIRSLDEDSAVMIVHNFGNIVNVPRLKKIRPDLIFIEDNCEGFFGKYEDIYSGTDSLCSSVSFYGNKTFTSGEGGAFMTNNTELYKYINKYYSHGMTDKRYIHDVLGNNYRMTNVAAALLYDQLLDYEHILNLKSEIFTYYEKYLNENINKKKVILLKKEEKTISSKWMFHIIIPSINYQDFETYMSEKNIQIRPFFYSINNHQHLIDIKNPHHNDFNENITNNGVMLPSYPELNKENIKYICLCINDYLL
jgi:perosamine synthetase